MPNNTSFPAPLYAEAVLSVNFGEAQRHFLGPLLEIHYTHTLMLARQGIIPGTVAARCLQGLDALDRDELAKARYDGQCEDLFFYVECALERICGPENAGRMHTARSRNDIDITQYRMRLRGEILVAIRAVSAARRTLLTVGGRHIGTIMPGYTHTQPAQPTTLAHYLLAVIELLSRDEQRLRAAFATVNRSPLGACAITTTGFPIDRYYTATLLGFEGLQSNSYGAIAATDYLTETAGAVATAMVNLGRVTQDLLLWCTAEFGYLRLSDAWVQISSIMPQKRNPVPLEHVRALASKALAQAQGVLTGLHNTPFGDINDAEDDIQPLALSAMADAVRAINLFAGVLEDCEVNTERMAERSHADFLTATELADTLVRLEGVSFREAHQVVSRAVRELRGQYSKARMVDAVFALAPAQFGHPLRATPVELMQSLDPLQFVNVRRIVGGPDPEAVAVAIREGEEEIARGQAWIAEKADLLAGYPKRIRQECEALLSERSPV